MGLVVGGWPGILFAAAPFLLTPETARWLSDTVNHFRQGETFLGYAAVLYLLPLLFAIHGAALVGVTVHWAFRRRRGGRHR